MSWRRIIQVLATQIDPIQRTNPYTFVNLANTIDKFTEQNWLDQIYCLPFRLWRTYRTHDGIEASRAHHWNILSIWAMRTTRALSPAFEGIKAMWASPDDPTKLEPLKHIFSPQGIEWAYTNGVESPSLISPDPPALDIYYTSREGALDIQLALLRDYENNVKSYPEWQAYLRKHKPKIVAVWGKHDPFFAPPGCRSFQARCA